LPSVILAYMEKDPLPKQEVLDSLPTNLFVLAIQRILAIKTGPFFEHSPQLHSIVSSVPRWEKVFTGLCKMYDVSLYIDLVRVDFIKPRQAEVLGKRVVVQHLPLGGIVAWDP
jgi:serine/threonine-protein phosphatase 2A activator